jgi:signal transduction histidine kinase
MKLSVQQLERAWKDKRDDFDDRMKRFTNSMVQQIDALSSIASEFSNFAQMPKARIERLEMKDIVEEYLELFKRENVEITFTCENEASYPVLADKAQIGRVLNNLLKNAIQAIPEDKPGLISIALSKVKGQLELIVSDNGSGIAKDQIEQIFLPNFTTKSGGMGLGLAMVKSIIEFSGGKITFETKIGEGTRFIILLPLAA